MMLSFSKIWLKNFGFCLRPPERAALENKKSGRQRPTLVHLAQTDKVCWLFFSLLHKHFGIVLIFVHCRYTVWQRNKNSLEWAKLNTQFTRYKHLVCEVWRKQRLRGLHFTVSGLWKIFFLYKTNLLIIRERRKDIHVFLGQKMKQSFCVIFLEYNKDGLSMLFLNVWIKWLTCIFEWFPG